ncbi:Brp/Blh family beta-carotene 15,15'-dioxygenase [Flexithrix dorotheae]|uniref:Brp/Blh family beta-carotene 15,15'-dioxygenase n=1 Tax=Flexithrix dorotheae TaxID=70993 RepID=UPI00037FD023|nr:Brp/Blh family beta-carotene 15,15'-dioxygenase [Flexithrix dorotheae]
MKKTNFIYWVLFLLLLSLSPILKEIDVDYQNQIALFFILLFGVPHGAIDNLLFFENSAVKPARFYFFYLSAVLVYVLIWLLHPISAFSFFLVLSAYHFGQSQFSEEIGKVKILSALLYLMWGLSVLSSFFFYNHEELVLLFQQHTDTHSINLILSESVIKTSYFTTSLFTVGIFGIYFSKNLIPIEKLAIEILILIIIHLTAYLFTFLLGFAMFFVLIHSFKALQSEFNFFYRKVSSLTLFQFSRQIMPLFLISVLGLSLLVYLTHSGILNLSYPLLFIIATSSITLPHAFVMERFYAIKKTN